MHWPVAIVDHLALGGIHREACDGGTYLVKVVCPGFAPSLRMQYLEKGQQATFEFKLEKPAALTVRVHVQQQKLKFPIAIDTPDGRGVGAYMKLGLCYGYPSYVLLSPEGTILMADDALPGPILRSYKLELIRAAVMGKQ